MINTQFVSVSAFSIVENVFCHSFVLSPPSFVCATTTAITKAARHYHQNHIMSNTTITLLPPHHCRWNCHDYYTTSNSPMLPPHHHLPPTDLIIKHQSADEVLKSQITSRNKGYMAYSGTLLNVSQCAAEYLCTANYFIVPPPNVSYYSLLTTSRWHY